MQPAPTSWISSLVKKASVSRAKLGKSLTPPGTSTGTPELDFKDGSIQDGTEPGRSSGSDQRGSDRDSNDSSNSKKRDGAIRDLKLDTNGNKSLELRKLDLIIPQTSPIMFDFSMDDILDGDDTSDVHFEDHGRGSLRSSLGRRLSKSSSRSSQSPTSPGDSSSKLSSPTPSKVVSTHNTPPVASVSTTQPSLLDIDTTSYKPRQVPLLLTDLRFGNSSPTAFMPKSPTTATSGSSSNNTPPPTTRAESPQHTSPINIEQKSVRATSISPITRVASSPPRLPLSPPRKFTLDFNDPSLYRKYMLSEADGGIVDVAVNLERRKSVGRARGFRESHVLITPREEKSETPDVIIYKEPLAPLEEGVALKRHSHVRKARGSIDLPQPIDERSPGTPNSKSETEFDSRSSVASVDDIVTTEIPAHVSTSVAVKPRKGFKNWITSMFTPPAAPLSQDTYPPPLSLPGRLEPDIEKRMYALAHVKLSKKGRELRQQVLISNFMVYVISVHADVTIRGRGPRRRRRRPSRNVRHVRPVEVEKVVAKSEDDDEESSSSSDEDDEDDGVPLGILKLRSGAAKI
jgi:Activator of mitotic machinery Cdc14 phosphatase activation C-term